MTCWQRLRDLHQAGVWDRLHQLVVAGLHAAGQLDWVSDSIACAIPL
jgi:hypothetical protein